MTSISMTNLSVNISLMDNFNNTINQLISGVQQLNNSFTRIEETLKEMCGLQSQILNKESNTTNIISQEISLTNVLNQSMQNVVNVQETINASAEENGNIMGKVFGVIKSGIQKTIEEAVKMQNQMISVQGMLGNKEAGGAYFNHLQKQANESGFAFEDLQSNARNFLEITKNTDSLDKLTNLSERLSLGNSSKGLDGAGSAIKDMMSGQGDSLKADFGFNDEDIGILKASKDMDDFTSKFDGLLNKKGLDGDMLGTFNSSATSQFDNLQSNLNTSLGTAGQGALEAFTPVLEMVNEMFSNGSFTPFFEAISVALTVIASIIGWVCELVINNWGIIAPILTAIGIYLLAMIIPSIVSATMTVLGFAAAWLVANWPILLIVGAIALVIYILMQCGVTCEQVCGFIGMAFMMAYTLIYNSIVLAWNVIASFIEFIANAFNQPLYSVQVLFANIWNSIVSFVGGALDYIVEKAKSIPFLKDLLGNFEVKDFKIDIPPPPDDYVIIPRMETKDMGNEAIYGYNTGSEVGANASEKLNGITSGVDYNAILNNYNKSQATETLPMNNMANTLNSPFGGDQNSELTNNVAQGAESLGNIESTVDVSNEHLEMLRDLAEQESIQNFVSLTPTVQVTTGDVRQESDINTIISHIETYMETELTNSAEGLYA